MLTELDMMLLSQPQLKLLLLKSNGIPEKIDLSKVDRIIADDKMLIRVVYKDYSEITGYCLKII